MNEITTATSNFNFEGANLRVVDVNGELWFVATDVCAALGLDNVSHAVSRLDDDERGITTSDTPSRNQHGSFGTLPKEMITVSESGMYSLILTSRKAEAKRFKKWVTSEVLPEIRKTGGYGTRQHQIPTNMTLVSKDLLKRCVYLGPKGRPTVQGKYLAKLQLPTIGQIGVTNEFGLHPHQLEAIEHESLLSLYVRQDLESSRGAEALMLEDQERIEAYQKQKAKIKLQAQITRAQAKLAQLDA